MTCLRALAVSDGSAALLTGFSFERPQGDRFGNRDHHLLEIGVNLDRVHARDRKFRETEEVTPVPD